MAGSWQDSMFRFWRSADGVHVVDQKTDAFPREASLIPTRTQRFVQVTQPSARQGIVNQLVQLWQMQEGFITVPLKLVETAALSAQNIRSSSTIL